jgi:hypothetical protein
MGRIEGYFLELLDKLERIAVVMERVDNVMNPTLGLVEDEFEEQLAEQRDLALLSASVRPQPATQAQVPAAPIPYAG